MEGGFSGHSSLYHERYEINNTITSTFPLQLCSENSYEPLIFTKKPETFNMTVMFGQMEPKTAKKCPTDKSRLQISGSFNVSIIIIVVQVW